MKTVIEVLTEARALVEQGWTQRAWARDRFGNAGMWDEPTACEWCLVGALASAGFGSGYNSAWKILRELTGDPLSAFNDAPGRTQAEVLDLLDRAIARASEQEVQK